jgi:transcriptional regulator with GAF, ATPase, and Fis domain
LSTTDDGTGAEPGGMAQLGLQFADIAIGLTRDGAAGVDPERLVRLAARAIPHAEHCAVTLLRHRQKPRTLAATGDLPLKVDELQYATGEGPCLAAATGGDLVLVRDAVTESRWPKFSRPCAEITGVRSLLGVRLPLNRDYQAALNLYAAPPEAFEGQDLTFASMLAPFAAMSVQSHVYSQEVEQLETALSTSRQIGAAVGILMSRRGVTYEQAFDQLRHASQRLNLKLRDLAAEVQWTGALPPVDGRKPTGKDDAKR